MKNMTNGKAFHLSGLHIVVIPAGIYVALAKTIVIKIWLSLESLAIFENPLEIVYILLH